MHKFYEGSICMGKERLKDPVHPTQKPVKLLSHLIKIASHEGDIIFDPFMGVASTSIAALQNNRNFIGIDTDKTYFKAAEKRIKDYVSQQPLFSIDSETEKVLKDAPRESAHPLIESLHISMAKSAA